MPDEVTFRREPIASLDRLESEWRGLEAVARPSFFTSWHWIGALLAALPPARRPDLLRGSNARGTVALALLGSAASRQSKGLIRSRGLYLNATGNPRLDSIYIEHNDLLMSPGIEAAVDAGLFRWFAGLAREADELHLGGSLRRWPSPAIEAAGLYHAATAVPSYSLDLQRLQASDGDIAAVLSANARQQLRRALREFERRGPLRLTAASTLREAVAFFAELKELHCRSWTRRGRPHAFTEAFFEQFHQLLVTRSFAAGVIHLLRVSAGDRALGYLYNFRFGDRVYAYQSGFAEAARHEHPGLICHALAIRDAYRAGHRVYDFMAGDNRLKQRFSTHCELMFWQAVRQPRLGFRLQAVARCLCDRLAGRDRHGNFETLPGTVLPAA